MDEKLGFWDPIEDEWFHGTLEVIPRTDGHQRVGVVEVEVLEGNVVITVRREDEAYFGPVSLVVV